MAEQHEWRTRANYSPGFTTPGGEPADDSLRSRLNSLPMETHPQADPEVVGSYVLARGEVRSILDEHGPDEASLPAGQRERAERMLSRAGKLAGQMRAEWQDRMDTLMGDPDLLARSSERADMGGSRPSEATSDPWRQRSGPLAASPADLRGRSLAAIERTGDAPDECRQRLTEMVERHDPGSREADLAHRYIIASSDPAYRSAFIKLLIDPQSGHRAFTTDELAAYQRAGMAQRSLQVGDGTASAGLMAPFSLDPSWMLTSAGAIDPIRRRASVATIAGYEWRGVTTAGVVARWAPESTETPDATPTLAQPTIRPSKADVFVPFSIESQQDASALEGELRMAYEDARASLEAAGWITGTGVANDQPEGLVTAVDGSASEVTTAGAGALAVDDVYSVAEALPPRFRAGASWLQSQGIYHDTRRLVPEGDTSERQIYSPDETRLLGKPWDEASVMAAAVTTGNTVLIFGDLARGYKIVDRVGLTVELVPHLLGANRRPTGERGLYAFWRTSAGVVNLSALRSLAIQ